MGGGKIPGTVRASVAWPLPEMAPRRASAVRLRSRPHSLPIDPSRVFLSGHGRALRLVSAPPVPRAARRGRAAARARGGAVPPESDDRRGAGGRTRRAGIGGGRTGRADVRQPLGQAPRHRAGVRHVLRRLGVADRARRAQRPVADGRVRARARLCRLLGRLPDVPLARDLLGRLRRVRRPRSRTAWRRRSCRRAPFSRP